MFGLAIGSMFSLAISLVIGLRGLRACRCRLPGHCGGAVAHLARHGRAGGSAHRQAPGNRAVNVTIRTISLRPRV
jgi:hypothetical protein